MLFARYDFVCTMLDDAILPPFKGSTFRGAFGNALKRVVCAVRSKDCADCLLAGRCVYARTFELAERSGADGARIAATPHPYVIEPPGTIATHLAKGASFDFSLLLFGAANDWLPYFIYAFEIMGEGGIGRKMGDKRPGFHIERVLSRGQLVYDGAQRKLLPGAPPESLTVPTPASGAQCAMIELQLLTPLRLKHGNSFASELPFHLLVRAMLRRISSLFASHGDGEPALDYRGLVAAAGQVETIGATLHWHDWERWSGRQEQIMLMGGLLGSITYGGDLAPFLPLLELSRQLHLGKQTSFGLGKIEYRYP